MRDRANGTSNEDVYLLVETPRLALVGLIVLVEGTLLSCSADPGHDSSSSEGGSAGSSGAGGDSGEGGSAGAAGEGGSSGAGGSSGTGGAGGGSGSAGTALEVGTLCIQAADGSERCETSSNGRREVISGNVAISVERGASFGCSGTALPNMSISTTIPDGVTLPYQGITRGTYHFVSLNNSCEWQQLGEAPASGIIYHDGTGEPRIEGELNFESAPVSAACGSSLENCPQQIDVRFRFNVPL